MVTALAGQAVGSLAATCNYQDWLINEENKLQEPICCHTSNQDWQWQPIVGHHSLLGGRY